MEPELLASSHEHQAESIDSLVIYGSRGRLKVFTVCVSCGLDIAKPLFRPEAAWKLVV